MGMNKFYITTPIYYVNSHPHLGHLYTTLVADTVARYKRQRGFETFFLTGTDEHGLNIERAAESKGLSIKEHVDSIVNEFKTAFAPYGLTNDHWIRTTDDYHKRAAQELWRRAKENGYIYKGKYEGLYCANCNEFYTESEAKAGDDGTLNCPTHERPLDRVAEESYFFKLSEFQDRLIELYEKNPNFIRPETRRNEVMSFVRGGLNDLRSAASRLNGASLCRTTPRTRCTSGSTRYRITSPPSVSPTNSSAASNISKAVARRPATCRQRHSALPHRLLARVSDCGRA